MPVGDDGTIVGLVSAGITTANVGGAANRQMPLVLRPPQRRASPWPPRAPRWSAGGLLRQTHGLGPREMTRMYEHHDAVLHAVREGVLIVGVEGTLLLANDEAHRLLDLPADAEGRHVRDLGLPPDTAGLLASGGVATDEVHLVKDRLLAINQRTTDSQGGPPGTVATLATPRSCARSPAAQRRHGSASTCCTTPGWRSEPAWT
ncbi:histidine kinase OS=Streptomyces alboniger OX=132473 GN=CP975_24865 PE=4 SV=1 [Streptomyces alboniger]